MKSSQYLRFFAASYRRVFSLLTWIINQFCRWIVVKNAHNGSVKSLCVVFSFGARLQFIYRHTRLPLCKSSSCKSSRMGKLKSICHPTQNICILRKCSLGLLCGCIVIPIMSLTSSAEFTEMLHGIWASGYYLLSWTWLCLNHCWSVNSNLIVFKSNDYLLEKWGNIFWLLACLRSVAVLSEPIIIK